MQSIKINIRFNQNLVLITNWIIISENFIHPELSFLRSISHYGWKNFSFERKAAQ